MGNNLIDQYSLLHFSTGIIARFFHIPFTYFFIMHFIFEYFENIPEIAHLINKIQWWPGKKPSVDSLINSVSDQMFAMLGWYVANKLDIVMN